MIYALLVLIGIIGGTVGSIAGLGGGIIVVPALLYMASVVSDLAYVTPQIAVGTSLFVIIFTGLSSTTAYLKQKKVDVKSGLVLFAGSGPGAIIGALLNKRLDVNGFYLYFGLFMIAVSFLLLFRNRLKPIPLRGRWMVEGRPADPADGEAYRYPLLVGVLIGFVVGLISGLFGIGGGSLMVPAMILLFQFPARVAVATSMFMITLSATVSSITHIQLGNVDWLLMALLVPGAWFGGKWGAWLNQKLNNNGLVILLRIVLIFVGVKMIWDAM
ncbi:sulfite exporter TauE/SafE family protein [Marinicrinis sediminis]|uniref:Probable membrane transporter protein n=1 Tax=Marinicrinis sediminis TaxID=1652465 RepID=A0ABW5RCP3_9BACL